MSYNRFISNAGERLSRRGFCAGGIAALAAPGAVRAATPRAPGGFAFSYFTNVDNGATGMRLALSADGLQFTPVRHGAPLIVPRVGEDRLMRDPCIARDPRDGRFHMTWTTGWTGITIGHASSANLIDWSVQQAIPVMAAFPGTHNCWAPELIHDAARGCFVIFWASTIEGAFPETRNPTGKISNHRIYCTTTRDFRSFTPTRLLYDPGFSVIDATFLRDGGKLYLFVKNETDIPVRKYVLWCEARSPLGPFGPLSQPITPVWSEGPTAYRAGDRIVMLFDRYREHRFGAVATTDMATWQDVSAQLSVPEGARHGTVLPIDGARLRRLMREA
jgi:hypothetical protein